MLACSVLQRMLRRNPLAALALNQPSMRSMSSLSIAEDVPFAMDDTTQANKDLPDGNLSCLNPKAFTMDNTTQASKDLPDGMSS